MAPGSSPGMAKDPRDYGVAGPHLACVHFVAPPYQRGGVLDTVEDPLRDQFLSGDADRAGDRVVEVGHDAVAPPADLVAKQSQMTERPQPDRAFADNAALGSSG